MRVTHIGWFAHRNFGDDLMTTLIHQKMTEANNGVPPFVYMYSKDKPTFSTNGAWIYGNEIFKRLFPRSMVRSALKKSDALVIGGGSILHSENSVSWKLAAAKYFKEQRPKGRLIGVNLGIGPFSSQKAENDCRELCSLFDGISVRDRASFDFLKSCQLTAEPILSFDIGILGIHRRSEPRKESRKAKKASVAFMAPISNYEKSHKLNQDLLNWLLARFDEVEIHAFCASSQFGDVTYANQLLEGCDSKPSLNVFDGSIDKFLRKIQESDFLITNRFHGAVAALVYSIPFVSLVYAKHKQKTFELLDELSMSSRCFQYESFSKTGIDSLSSFIGKIPEDDISAWNASAARGLEVVTTTLRNHC